MQTTMGAFSLGWEDNYNGESVGMTSHQLLALKITAEEKPKVIFLRPIKCVLQHSGTLRR